MAVLTGKSSSGMVSNRSCALVRRAVELLEDRRLFAIFLDSAIADISVRPGASDSTISLASRFRTTNLDSVTGSIVRMPVKFGSGASAVDASINVRLYDTATPLTVQNFLNYVTADKYDNSIVHLSTKQASDSVGVIQGGGFTYSGGQFDVVSVNDPVENEFAKSPTVNGKVNVRGTIAMAKNSGSTNSSSQWFINVTDNSTTLDNTSNSGGYTVFGEVLGGMGVVDAINALTVYNASSISSAFASLPLASYSSGSVKTENVVRFSTPEVVSSPTTHFDYKVVSSDPKVAAVTLDSNGNLVIDYPTKVKQGTTTVTLTATDLTGANIQETFTITVASPALAVTVGTTKVTAGQSSPVDLGTVFTGQQATRTITLKNSGKGTLNLGDVTVPEGYSIASTLPETLAPGASFNLVLSVDTSAERTLSGTLSISSDATTDPFTFGITSEVGSSVRLTSSVKSVVYTDANGTRTTFSFKGAGLARLTFSGDNLAANTLKSGIEVSGGSVSLSSFALESTDSTTVVSSSAKGGQGSVTIGSLTSTSAFKQINFKGVSVADSLSLTAGGGDLTLAGLSSATADFGSAATGVAVRKFLLGAVSDSNLNLGGVFKTLTLGAVTGGSLSLVGGSVSTLSAASLGNLSVASSVYIGTLKVSGSVTGVTFSSTQAVGKFEASTLTGSTLRIGVVTEGLPDSSDDFGANSSLASLTLKSKAADPFSGSTLAVSKLGKLSLGVLTDAASGSNIVATEIVQLSGRPGVGKAFSLKALNSSSTVGESLLAAGVSEARLRVTLV